MRLTVIPLLVFLLLSILAYATYLNIIDTGISSIVEEENIIGWCGNASFKSRSIHQVKYSEAKISEGKSLFKANCASCHAKNMKSDLTGPALGGVEQRWSAYPKEDLYAFIRNSQGMIEKGHPRANEVWDEWQPTVMNNFPNLSDDQIESLLVYIETIY